MRQPVYAGIMSIMVAVGMLSLDGAGIDNPQYHGAIPEWLRVLHMADHMMYPYRTAVAEHSIFKPSEITIFNLNIDLNYVYFVVAMFLFSAVMTLLSWWVWTGKPLRHRAHRSRPDAGHQRNNDVKPGNL